MRRIAPLIFQAFGLVPLVALVAALIMAVGR